MRAAGTEASAAISKSFNADFTAIKGDLNSLDAEFKKIWKGFGSEAEDAGDRMRRTLSTASIAGESGKPTVAAFDDDARGARRPARSRT